MRLITFFLLCSSAFAATGDILAVRISGSTYQTSTNCAISSTVATTTLTCTGGAFAATDVNYPIQIAGAGAAGAVLATYITAYTSTTIVTVSVAASTTVSGATVTWGGSSNGSVAEIDIATGGIITTGGVYSFGLGTNNACNSSAKLYFTLTSSGYTAAGGSTTYTRHVCGTLWWRLPFPSNATAAENVVSTTLTIRVALSDFVYSGDSSIALNAATGVYTQGGNSNNSAGAFSVTNNSMLAYPSPKFRWVTVPYQRITGNFVIETTGDDRFAGSQGAPYPVATVVYTCTDAHSNSYSTTVTQMTISNQGTNDQYSVLVYAGIIVPSSATPSAFTQADLLTCNAIWYPWIGTSLTSATGNTPPTALLSPLLMLCDTSQTYGTAWAVVDAANGHASNADTWVYGTQSTAETNYASSNANSYADFGRAQAACKAYNNATFSRNDPGGCTIEYAASTSITFPNTSPAASGAMKTWLNVTTLSTLSRTQVAITTGAISSFDTQLLHISGISFGVPGTAISSVVILYSGNTSTDCLWIDKDYINSAVGATEFYVFDTGWATGNTIQAMTDGFLESLAQHGAWALIRGNSAPSTSAAAGPQGQTYAIVGNANIRPYYMQTGNSQGDPISDGSVFSFNSLLNSTAGVLFNESSGGAAVTGWVVDQNLLERVSSAVSPMLELCDTSVVNCANLISHHNTMIGARIDQLYNYTGSPSPGPLFMTSPSYFGNIWDNYNYNGDNSTPTSAAHTGAMVIDYSIGQFANLKAQTQSAGFQGVFVGTGSIFGGVTPSTTAKPQFVSDNSYNDGLGGNGTGNGNYHLNSNSPANNLILRGTAVLPYDISGQIRNNSGWGSAGTYEQAIIQTQVFGW